VSRRARTTWGWSTLLVALAGCVLVSSVLSTTLAAVDGPGEHQGAGDASEPSPFLEQTASRIIDLTNDFRRGEGEAPLATNERLVDTASDFAAYMARTGRYGHQADGKTPAERARDHGYDICLIAENIGWQLIPTDIETNRLAEAFVEGWKESSGHRANMLDSAAREIGAAVSQSRDSGRFYAVQLFGRPRSMQIQLEITNDSDVAVHYALGDRGFSLPPRYGRTHKICRPSALRIEWPNDQGSISITPEDGEQFRIARDADGQLRLREQ